MHAQGEPIPEVLVRTVTNHLLQGVVLAATFAVSHNVESTKPVAAGSVTTSNLMSPVAERDWGVQQVCQLPAPVRPLCCKLVKHEALLAKQVIRLLQLPVW